MEYGAADSISVEKWSLVKKDMGFQVITLSECRCCLESIANAECYGSSEWSYGIEHGLRSNLQLFLSETDSGVYPYTQMVQLSHGQFFFFGGDEKNTRIRTHLKHILFIYLFQWFISKVIKQLQQRVYDTLTEKQGQTGTYSFPDKLSIKTNTYSLQTTTTEK